MTFETNIPNGVKSVRMRVEKEANYRSFWSQGKTIRFAIDAAKEVTELRFPEFWDISFGTKCSGGCVDVCYASALKNGVHYKNLARKIQNFFGKMNENQRPYQKQLEGNLMEWKIRNAGKR